MQVAKGRKQLKVLTPRNHSNDRMASELGRRGIMTATSNLVNYPEQMRSQVLEENPLLSLCKTSVIPNTF